VPLTEARDTAAAIVAAARDIIADKGESGLRVTDLAERCGIATMTTWPQ